jgi:hypothetical protein
MFKNSTDYWEKRYKGGDNSGIGSYGKLAEFKAEIINSFIKDNNIQTSCEFGCGDGNQLSLLEVNNYIGYDVSDTILNKCKVKFKDTNKKFYNVKDYNNEKYDLSLSLDVIYHLVENDIFETYMSNLFNSSDNVIIYSSNFIDTGNFHVKHRKFTTWVESNRSDYKLIETIDNPYSKDSSADFFIYKKNK